MELTGKLLIAMPGMPDPRFEHAVVLVCAHSPEGAMGLIVNKPLPQPALGELMGQIGIHMTASDRGERASAGSAPILFGGPVETGRGFVLHSRDWPSARRDAGAGGMMQISEQVAMTATRDILEDIAAGEGPRLAQFALGYAGWGPGQLEGEIAHEDWMTAPADPSLIFGDEGDDLWERVIKSAGQTL